MGCSINCYYFSWKEVLSVPREGNKMSPERYVTIKDAEGTQHQVDCEPDGIHMYENQDRPPYRLTLKEGPTIVISDENEWNKLSTARITYARHKILKSANPSDLQKSLIKKVANTDLSPEEMDEFKRLLSPQERENQFWDDLKRYLDQ